MADDLPPQPSPQSGSGLRVFMPPIGVVSDGPIHFTKEGSSPTYDPTGHEVICIDRYVSVCVS